MPGGLSLPHSRTEFDWAGCSSIMGTFHTEINIRQIEVDLSDYQNATITTDEIIFGGFSTDSGSIRNRTPASSRSAFANIWRAYCKQLMRTMN